MKTIIVPKNSTGGGTVDVGPGPLQIPNNNIVQTKLNTYSILGKMPGNEDPQIPDNARVKSLINSAASIIDESLESLDGRSDILEVEVNNIKNNMSEGVKYQLPCSEGISQGKYISIWEDNGVSKVRLANASNGRLADGFTKEAFSTGDIVTFFDYGENKNGNSCPRGKIYLSATSPGDATDERPLDKSGHWCQELGKCIGENLHIFKLGLPIQLL